MNKRASTENVTLFAMAASCAMEWGRFVYLARTAIAGFYTTLTLSNPCKLPTGVSEARYGETAFEPTQNRILVYPNPATGMLNIKCPTDLTGHRIALTDLLGRYVLSEIITANQSVLTVSLAGISGGLYFVRIAGSSGIILLKEKLIVN